jgi:hypothetical protein
MKPDLPAAVADRDDAAVRTTADSFAGLDAQNQAVPGCRDRADVDAFDTEQRIRALHQRPPEQDIELFMSGSLLGIGLLGRYQFKEALASLLPHHAARHQDTLPPSLSEAPTTLICEGPNNWTSSGDPPAESEDSQAGSLRSGMVTPRSCTTSLG